MNEILRLLVIADSFGSLVKNAIEEHSEAVQRCHAIIGLGDMPSTAYPTLRGDLNLKMRGFCVLGNHDGLDWWKWLPRYRFEHLHQDVASLRFQDQDVVIAGFSGSEMYAPGKPWQWTDGEAARLMKKLPACDILISHTTAEHPAGHQDDPRHRGLSAIGAYIEQHQPYLALHGHFHQNYGRRIGRTQVIGCFGAVLVDCIPGEHEWQVKTTPIVKFPW